MFKDVFQNNQIESPNGKASLICCFCQNKIELEQGVASLDELPKNLHLDSLMKLMEGEMTPQTSKPQDNRCAKCQTVSTEEQHVCQHCMKVKHWIHTKLCTFLLSFVRFMRETFCSNMNKY